MQYKFLINDFRLLRRNLLHDLLRQRENTHTYTFIKALISNTSFKICFWFRVCQYLSKYNIAILSTISKLIYRHYQFKTGIQIDLDTNINEGLSIAHFSCIVISAKSIGRNFTIMQGCTIGSQRGGKKAGIPTIGNNVVVCAGAKVIDNIKIGNNVMIGANAVVVSDIPDNAVCAGIPAQIINMNGIEKTSYHYERNRNINNLL